MSEIHTIASGTQPLTKTDWRILGAIAAYGEPVFNGTLAAIVGISWRSKNFAKLEKAGLIAGHPIELTAKGSAMLAAREGGAA